MKRGNRFKLALLCVALFGVGILAWTVLVGLLLHRMMTGADSSWLRRGRSLSAAFALLFLSHSLLSEAFPPFNTQAVLLTDSAVVHEQPDTHAPEILRIHEGLVVDVSTETDGWTLIRISNGTRGWISTSSLGDI